MPSVRCLASRLLLLWLPVSLGLIAAPAFAGAEASETERIAGLQWQTATSGEPVKWPDAVDYCADLELDGHTDWRLPGLDELEALHDPETETGIRAPFRINTCCLWSGESLAERPAEDGDEIAGSPEMYHWGFMFDGGMAYYAVHIYEDGEALCTRDLE